MVQASTPAGMADYYAKRASYYERVYRKPERQDDLRAMEAAIGAQFAGRRVLEVACGTGWWTPHGAQSARSWLATDLNPETIAIARAKPLPRHADCSAIVEFRIADAFTFEQVGTQTFDAAFAGFWWSHVPIERLAGWLELLHARLEPGARVVMLDNRFVPGSSTPISRTDSAGNSYQLRPLDDGSTHEVLKNFPTAEAAIAVLGARAHSPQWTAYSHYWLLAYDLA